MPIETDNHADISNDVALLESEETPVETKTEEKPGKTTVKVPEKTDKKVVSPEVDEVDKVLEELEAFEGKTEEEIEENEAPEEILPHQRPTIKQISEKFPNLFKTFPSLKDSWFLEKSYSEIFHNPVEAKQAFETAATYNDLIDDVVNGTGEKVLPALKESDSLEKFSKNFLPNLYKLDKDVHWKVILPVLEDIVRVSYRDGVGRNDENLQNAARVLSIYLFNNMDVAEGKRTFVEKEEPKKDTKVEAERRDWENQKYNSTLIDINEHCFGEMAREINKGYRESDNLTKFMRESITERVMKEVLQTVRSDKTHMRYIDRLWAEAKSRGYRIDDKTRIINASLARAKSLIPSIRRKLIAEAIGSTPSNGQRKVETVQKTAQRRDSGSAGAVANHRPPNSKRIDWKRTSDLDFLNDNYKLRT